MKTEVSTGGIGIGGLLFLVLLIIKITEKCPFWNGTFPDWLKSTDRWWDGWFLVFSPLWVPLAVVIVLLALYTSLLLIFKAVSKD